MKLACRICHTPIPQEAVSFAEGICARCDEQIAASLPECDPIARVEKPADSKVEIVADNDSLEFNIPSEVNKGRGVFLLIFSLIMNTLGWLAVGITFRRGFQLMDLLFIPFVLFGAVLFLAMLLSFWGKYSLLIDREMCQESWSLFRWSYRKKYLTKEITAVREAIDVLHDYGPVYRVGIFYGKKTLKFGRGLSEVERKWLVGEIRHFLKL